MADTIDLPVKQTIIGTGNQNQPLSDCVTHALQNYFSNLGGQTPANLYEMVLREVEGLSTREVATILGSTEVTVRAQICTARIKLKKFTDRCLRKKS